MIDIRSRVDCCGCSACASICPQRCITITEDREGFDYPIVNTEKCVNCGLCDKVCPMNGTEEKAFEPYTLCVQNTDESIRQNSSAGGFAGAVFRWIFERDGIVYGVGFDDNNYVRYFSVQSMDECFEKKLFSSKYVSAETDGVFCDVKRELDSGRTVCFVGLPCQCSGLRSYLQKEYDNLIVIDLTCYGVPSRKLYREYLDFLESKYSRSIKDVRFRDKTYGYAAPTMCIKLDNGKIKSQNSAVKSFLRCFFAGFSSRPSCYECQFKTVKRQSDFTLGDLRTVYQFAPFMDDNLGTTVVYIQSKKGEEIIRELEPYIRFAPVDIKDVLKTSGKKMTSSQKSNPARKAFFKDIDDLEYDKLVRKHCPADINEKMINILKGALLITGLNRSDWFKKLKRR